MRIHELYSKDGSLCKKVLAFRPECLKYSVIELAFMAESRKLLCNAAVKEFVHERWWGQTFSETDQNDTGCWQKARRMVQIPGVKFILSAVTFFIFLVIYSISVLTGSFTQMNIVEYVICVWMVILLVEEALQVRSLFKRYGKLTLWKKWQHYIFDFWNILDWIMFILYGVGFVLRVVSYFTVNVSILTAAHALLAFNALIIFIRSLQFLSMHSQIGPLLIMVFYMCIDLLSFMLILLVILLGYGVASHAVLHPSSPLSWSLLYAIIQGPYEQLHGELNADEVRAPSNRTSSFTPASITGFGEYFGLVLADLYILFTNVLLLNLLIAMFNSSYNRVREETDYHNVSHMYEVLREFEAKSVIPPPLVFIKYVYMLCKCVTKRLTKRCREMQSGDSEGNQSITFNSDEKLSLKSIIQQVIEKFNKTSQKQGWSMTKDTAVGDTAPIKDVSLAYNLEEIKPLVVKASEIKDEQCHLASEIVDLKQDIKELKQMLEKQAKREIQAQERNTVKKDLQKVSTQL